MIIIKHNKIKNNKINKKNMSSEVFTGPLKPPHSDGSKAGTGFIRLPDFPEFKNTSMSYQLDFWDKTAEYENSLSKFSKLKGSNELLKAIIETNTLPLYKQGIHGDIMLVGELFSSNNFLTILETAMAILTISNHFILRMRGKYGHPTNKLYQNLIQILIDDGVTFKKLTLAEEERIFYDLSCYFSSKTLCDPNNYYFLIQALLIHNPWLLDYLNSYCHLNYPNARIVLELHPKNNPNNCLIIPLGYALFLASCNNMHLIPYLGAVFTNIWKSYREK